MKSYDENNCVMCSRYFLGLFVSNKTLQDLAIKSPPPQKWFDGDEPKPF